MLDLVTRDLASRVVLSTDLERLVVSELRRRARAAARDQPPSVHLT